MFCCEAHRGGAAPGAADPASHVNYTKGMVLGVDDYRQEHAYLAGTIHWLARETLGYGVTSGLAVLMEDSPEGPVVRVAAGAALVPSGRLVCVPADQCARLNAWLAIEANAATVEGRLAAEEQPHSPPDQQSVALYVVLSHRECLTAAVPIPGAPCRSEDELMAPSRTTDDFRLELVLEPPPMREHDAAARFAALLGGVAVDPDPEAISTEASEWRATLEAWAEGLRTGEDPQPTSPPTPPLILASRDWPAFQFEAVRVWVSRVRPEVMARRCRTPGSNDDERLVLARLDMPIIHVGVPPADQWQVDGVAADVTVDESVRASLPSLQLVSMITGAKRPAAG